MASNCSLTRLSPVLFRERTEQVNYSQLVSRLNGQGIRLMVSQQNGYSKAEAKSWILEDQVV